MFAGNRIHYENAPVYRRRLTQQRISQPFLPGDSSPRGLNHFYRAALRIKYDVTLAQHCCRRAVIGRRHMPDTRTRRGVESEVVKTAEPAPDEDPVVANRRRGDRLVAMNTN